MNEKEAKLALIEIGMLGFCDEHLNRAAEEPLMAFSHAVRLDDEAVVPPLMSEAEAEAEADAEEGLEILFAYTEKEHAFTDAEKHALIAAKDLRILAPASALLNVDAGSLSQAPEWLRASRVAHATPAASFENPSSATRQNAASTLKTIRSFIEGCTARNLGEKLNCLETASPDLFAFIKQEGRV